MTTFQELLWETNLEIPFNWVCFTSNVLTCDLCTPQAIMWHTGPMTSVWNAILGVFLGSEKLIRWELDLVCAQKTLLWCVWRLLFPSADAGTSRQCVIHVCPSQVCVSLVSSQVFNITCVSSAVILFWTYSGISNRLYAAFFRNSTTILPRPIK